VLNATVLVLNRSYLPIHVTSARRAFALIYRDVARVAICVPRVILLPSFDRVPKRHVRYSRVNVFARDKFTCQYCGERPHRSELNLDHVIPRALGGRTTWENVVCSCVECNRRKGGRTPQQARLRLKRIPAKPRWTPLMNHIGSSVRYNEWRPFLSIVERNGRTAGCSG